MPRAIPPWKKAPASPPTGAISLHHRIEIDSVRLSIALRGQDGELFVDIFAVTVFETSTRTPLSVHLSTGRREFGKRGRDDELLTPSGCDPK